MLIEGLEQAKTRTDFKRLKKILECALDKMEPIENIQNNDFVDEIEMDSCLINLLDCIDYVEMDRFYRDECISDIIETFDQIQIKERNN